MKVLQSLVLIGLFCIFSFVIKAQADCRYGIKFFVQDESGKRIENVKLELVPLDSTQKLPAYVRLTKMDDAYIFTSSAGTTVNGDFQVNISAFGFKTYQQKVNFPVCKMQEIAVKLQLTNKEKNTSILSGSIYDAYGALIIGAKITAINEKGEKFEAKTNEDGIYNLELPYHQYNGKYDYRLAKYEIIVEKENFEKTIIKNFKFAPSHTGKVNLDFAMDVFVNINIIRIQTDKNNN